MPTLSLTNLTLRYGAVTALDQASVSIVAGEVHAILGENGAGKSTLMHACAGLVRPDGGEITTDDGVTRIRGFRSRAEARAAGIGLAHQHFTSVPTFSVADNIALSAGWRETGEANDRRAATLLESIGFRLSVSVAAGTLPVQSRQQLEIAMALASEPRVLLLDEPTAVLAPAETAELLRRLRQLARRGVAVVLITHKLREVLEVADRVTVMRRGRVVLDAVPATSMSVDSLASAMIGEALVPLPAIERRLPGDPVVIARELTLRGDAPGGIAIEGANLSVRGGEIVGIAALPGSGQRQLLRALASVSTASIVSGSLDVRGDVAFIPEDRVREGMIADFTLEENVALGDRRDAFWMSWREIGDRTRMVMHDGDVRAPGVGVLARTLSGGNQQKLLLARELARRPALLVAEDPSRGLDVHATAAVYARLREAAAAGAAIVVHAADLDELVAIADRVIVVTARRLVEMPAGSDRMAIGAVMLGTVPAT